MRTSHWGILTLALVAAAGIAATQAQTQAPAQPKFVVGQPPTPPGPDGPKLAGLPDPYHVENNWAKMPPGRIWGGAAGIGIDRDGKSVWFAERCDNTNNGCSLPQNKGLDPILEFDTDGNLVKSFGAGMFHYPHGLFVDRNGNIWVADGIANPEGGGRPRGAAGAAVKRPPPDPQFVGDTVREFTPDGKLLMTIGKEGTVGDGPYTFNGVSAVAVAANGDIFVGDGHGGNVNDRIVKYDSHGKFLMAWGKFGTGPSDLNPPHGLAIDKEGRIYVADRSNNAVKVFDQNGKLLHVWPQFGSPSGVFVDKNDVLYVADATSVDDKTSRWYNPGFGNSGIRIGRVSDGKITANIPWGEYSTLEGVAVDDAGTIYGAFTNKPGAHRWIKN